MTGGVSHAVGAMLASAAWLYAAGEFAAELGAETGDVDSFKTAATLTATARTHDMGAWELATREAAGRPRSPADAQADLRARLLGGDDMSLRADFLRFDDRLARLGVPSAHRRGGATASGVARRVRAGNRCSSSGACVGRGAAKSTALYKLALFFTLFGDWTCRPASGTSRSCFHG